MSYEHAPCSLAILPIVLLLANVAAGAFELSLKAFALSFGNSVSSSEAFIDADLRLLGV